MPLVKIVSVRLADFFVFPLTRIAVLVTFSRGVPFLPISSLNIDHVARLDGRIAKLFPITERFRTMFTFDAFNVFNHTYFTSVSTRAYTLATVAGVPTLTPASGFGAGSATQGFPDGANTRRLQIGVRLLW